MVMVWLICVKERDAVRMKDDCTGKIDIGTKQHCQLTLSLVNLTTFSDFSESPIKC